MQAADRKKQLIAQGRIYRAEVVLAKEATRASLRPEALAKNLFGRLAVGIVSVFRSRDGAGLNVSTLLPLLMGGMSAWSKKRAILRPLLRGALIGSVIAGAFALFSKKRQKSSGQQGVDSSS